MKTVPRERLIYLIGFVREALAYVDQECGRQPQHGQEGYTFKAMDAWWRKRDQAFKLARERLASEGAAFSFKSAHDHVLRLAGIRSSSTSGWQGAFYNWITAAERRLKREGDQ